MQKDVAGQKIGCQMVSATDGSAFTSAVTISVTGDAGTQATGSVGSGACTHEGNGYHTYAPAQGETNHDLIAYTFTGSGAVPATIQIYTRVDSNAILIEGSDPTEQINAACDAAFVTFAGPTKAEMDTAHALLATPAQVNTQCDAAIVTYKLDHLVYAAESDDPVNDSIMAKLAATGGDWSTFVEGTDSLQAIRDEGNSAWATAVGFSTHNAAAVWSSVARTLTAATNITSDGAAINTTSGVVDTVTANTDMRGTDSAALASSLATLTTTVGAAGVGLTDLGGMSTDMKAEINTEVDSGIVTYGLDHLVSVSVAGADIVDNSIVAKLVSKESTADWDDFDNTDDSLQAIRDEGSSNWITGGGSSLTLDDIADAVLNETLAGHTGVDSLGKAIADIETDATAILEDTSTTLDAAIAVVDLNVDQIETAIITNAAGTNIAFDIIAIKAETADIVADTGELQTDDIPASLSTISTKIDAVDNYVDSEVAAIKAVTDNLPSSGALTDLPVNMTKVLGSAISGNMNIFFDNADAVTTKTVDDVGGSGASAASIANEVWDRASTSHTTSGTFGKYLDAEISGVSSSASPTLLQSTTIATLSSQTVFTLTAGSTDNDAFNGCTCIITDGTTSTRKAIGEISDYVGLTRTVTLAKDPGVFAYEAGDSISIVSEGSGSRQDELLTDVSNITVVTPAPAGSVTYVSGVTFSIAQSNGNTGWPPTIRRGSGYTVANGSAFKLTPQDNNGDAIESLGTTDFSDTPAPLFHFDKMKNQDNIQDFVGSVSWVAAAGEIDGHWLLTITTTETVKASTYTEYMGHLILWPGGSDQTTILSQRFSIAPNISAS